MPKFAGKKINKGSARKARAIKKIKKQMKKASRQAFKKGLDPKSVKLHGRKNCGEYVFTEKGVINFD